MPKPAHVEHTTTQKVNNADGTQTEITVKERRLKKNHDKQMSRIQSRQRRAAAEQHLQQSSVDLTVTAAAKAILSDEPSSDMPKTLGMTSKADRRKKAEPLATTPETESPAADSESGDSGPDDSESGVPAVE